MHKAGGFGLSLPYMSNRFITYSIMRNSVPYITIKPSPYQQIIPYIPTDRMQFDKVICQISMRAFSMSMSEKLLICHAHCTQTSRDALTVLIHPLIAYTYPSYKALMLHNVLRVAFQRERGCSIGGSCRSHASAERIYGVTIRARLLSTGVQCV